MNQTNLLPIQIYLNDKSCCVNEISGSKNKHEKKRDKKNITIELQKRNAK